MPVLQLPAEIFHTVDGAYDIVGAEGGVKSRGGRGNLHGGSFMEGSEYCLGFC